MDFIDPRPVTAALARAKRTPSPKNQEIYKAIRVLGQRQTDVARRYGLTQQRVSQICRQFEAWLDWLQQAPDLAQLKRKQRRLEWLRLRERTERDYEYIMRELLKGDRELATEKTTQRDGQTVVVRTMRQVQLNPMLFRLAQETSRRIARINLHLGIDVAGSPACQELDAQLARLLAEREESAGVIECESLGVSAAG